jgi:hypothetical protein
MCREARDGRRSSVPKYLYENTTRRQIWINMGEDRTERCAKVVDATMDAQVWSSTKGAGGTSPVFRSNNGALLSSEGDVLPA